MVIWGKRVPGRGNSKCKVPEANMYLTFLLFLEHVSVLEHSKRGGEVTDNRVREEGHCQMLKNQAL